jgi:hypothetical protein
MYTIMYEVSFHVEDLCMCHNDGTVSNKRSHFIQGNMSLLCVQINELQKREEVTDCKLKRRIVILDSRLTSLCPCLPNIPRTAMKRQILNLQTESFPPSTQNLS